MAAMNLLIDYEQLATNPTVAMRKVTQLMQRAGAQALKVEGAGTKRVAGISYREVTMTFADSQTMGLRIKATGDVYQVLLNGKIVPVKEQDDFAKACSELALMLDKNRLKFQKRMELLKMKPPEGIKTAAPRLLDVLTKQVQDLDVQIADARTELAELQAA